MQLIFITLTYFSLTNVDTFLNYSTKEECSKSTCSSSMEKLSMAILNDFAKFVAVISELDTYLRLLASAGKL